MSVTAKSAKALLETKKSEVASALSPFLAQVKDEVDLAIENLSNKCSVSMTGLAAEWHRPAIKTVEEMGFTAIYITESQVLHLVF